MSKEIVTISNNGSLSSVLDMSKMLPELISQKNYKNKSKVWQSKFRKEAEQEFDRTGNISQVCRFMKDKGENISRQAVSRYFKNYYFSDHNAELVADYADDLNIYKKFQYSKEERLRTQLAMVDKALMEINSNTNQGDINEMRRSADVTVKLHSVSLSIQKQLNEIEAGMEPVYILIERFTNMIQIQIESVKSSDARHALSGLLDSLQDQMEDMEIIE